MTPKKSPGTSKDPLRKKINYFYAHYKEWDINTLRNRLNEILFKNVLVDTTAVYYPHQDASFYRLLRLNKKQKVKKSFFYERKDKDKAKIREERFNLAKEQVLYLTAGVPAICLKEVNCSEGDEVLLIEYKLKEEIQLCDFSFRIDKKMLENCLTKEFIVYFSKKMKECENDYFITNYIKKMYLSRIKDGILYSSVYSLLDRPCPNVCLKKGVARKKLKIGQILRGKILEYVEPNNFKEKHITENKVFSMCVDRQYYLVGFLLISEKIKNQIFVATTTDKMITEEGIVGLSRKVFR